YLKLVSAEVSFIDIGNFEFTASTWFQIPGDVNYAVVGEIQTGHCKMRFRLQRFFVDGNYPLLVLKFHYTIALRSAHVIGKTHSAIGFRISLEFVEKPRPVKYIVAQHEGHAVVADKISANGKSLS